MLHNAAVKHIVPPEQLLVIQVIFLVVQALELIIIKIFKVGILKYFNSPTLRNRRRFWETLYLKIKKTSRCQTCLETAH